MSEVKRWNVESDEHDGPCSLWNIESAEGEFVKYEDYAAIKAERDALAAENAALKVLADACSREYESPKTEACEDDEKVAYPEEACNITFGMIRSAARTPATDACLNSVRADAVNHAGKMVIAMMNHQDKGVERALECIAEVEMQYTLAAQLRAGEPS